MEGRNAPLSTPQMCQLLALLTQYQAHLLYEGCAKTTAEGVQVTELCEAPLRSVNDCIKTVSQDLGLRLPLF